MLHDLTKLLLKMRDMSFRNRFFTFPGFWNLVLLYLDPSLILFNKNDFYTFKINLFSSLSKSFSALVFRSKILNLVKPLRKIF